MATPNVFISYSQDSDEHSLKVLSFAKQLRKDGIEVYLDQYLLHPPAEGWPNWKIQQIKNADFTLLVCTKNLHEAMVNGQGDGKIINSFLYDDESNTTFIPTLFDKNNAAFVPQTLRDTQYVVSNQGQYFSLYRRLTDQPNVKADEVGSLKKLSNTDIPDFFEQQEISERPSSIDLSRLPTTSTPLFGRQAELELLDQAWDNSQTRIFSLVAFGGVGKTALVNEWLNRLDAQNFKGAVRVYGWSFYSQGTREDGQASADGFINDAIQWFEENSSRPDRLRKPVRSSAETLSPHEKGRYLARLIAEQPTLLVLDGLEPLQYPPGAMYGRLKDQSMQALLKGLARSMNGLCLLSTRCEVEELKTTKARFTPTHELERLRTPAGVQLLQHFGLHGPQKEFEDTVEDFQGHALALNLIGSYLRTVHGGELRRRDAIPDIFEEEKQGGHARRVMASYAQWFANKPELDVLHLLGLFDRPVEKEVIDVLKAEPAIPGLTDKLYDLSHARWQTTLQHLRDARLLNKDTDTLDCHPLIREHFGEQLQQNYPDAWTAAHARLYEYYKNQPDKELPDTLEEMEPLFLAVRHGCLAGKQQETYDVIFWDRLCRREKYYILHQLGAFNNFLSLLSYFFENLWKKVVIDLSENARANVLSQTGYALKALGRLEEATQPMQASLNFFVEKQFWKEAAREASNISELMLSLGEISYSLDYGQQGLEYAHQSKDVFQKEARLCRLANNNLQFGNFNQAEILFQKAEKLQRERQSKYKYLYSLKGYWFCDLLLFQNQNAEVFQRAKTTLTWAKENNFSISNQSFDLLSIGKALFQQAQQAAPPDFSEAADYLHQAIVGLRKAGQQDDLPLGLLARTALYRAQAQYALAWEDLDEVLDIATYGSMQLFLTDYYLEGARLLRAQLQEGQATIHIQEQGEQVSLTRAEAEEKYRAFVAEAERLIQETGYHRRDGELVALQEGL